MSEIKIKHFHDWLSVAGTGAWLWHGLAGSKSVLKLVIIAHVGTLRRLRTPHLVWEKLSSFEPQLASKTLIYYMLTGISDGGFDTKHLNIIYYQNINQMILMDILQQSLIHIHCKPLYLKCLDERLRLFSNICIIISVSKRFEKIITRKTDDWSW